MERTASETRPRRGRQGGTPRDWATQALADGRIESHKQVIATLRKWGAIYDYGVSEDLGWRLFDGPLPKPRETTAEIERRIKARK